VKPSKKKRYLVKQHIFKEKRMPSVSGRINHKYSTEILILPHFSSKKQANKPKNKRKGKKKLAAD